MPDPPGVPDVNLILIGPRGSGKTSVGRRLAGRLSRPFFDMDGWIEREAGKSIAEIFSEGGENLFRALEARAVACAMGGGLFVVSAGGGAVENPENVKAFREGGRVFWLTAEKEVLLSRISSDPSSPAMRPPLTRLDPAEEMAEVLRRREPLYRQACHHVLDTGTRTIEEVAEEVVKILVKG